jgi:hypothetical protein
MALMLPLYKFRLLLPKVVGLLAETNNGLFVGWCLGFFLGQHFPLFVASPQYKCRFGNALFVASFSRPKKAA